MIPISFFLLLFYFDVFPKIKSYFAKQIWIEC